MLLQTWAKRRQFTYTGSVPTGTEIQYGNGSKATVSDQQYLLLLTHFSKKEVPIGTSRSDPPKGSLGRWLRANVTPTAIASYVGPILVWEGYAIVGAKPDRIRFL
jgi:hypothetical protein